MFLHGIHALHRGLTDCLSDHPRKLSLPLYEHVRCSPSCRWARTRSSRCLPPAAALRERAANRSPGTTALSSETAAIKHGSCLLLTDHERRYGAWPLKARAGAQAHEKPLSKAAVMSQWSECFCRQRQQQKQQQQQLGIEAVAPLTPKASWLMRAWRVILFSPCRRTRRAVEVHCSPCGASVS